MLYQCDLVFQGVVYERFFHEENNIQDVYEYLESFQWPTAPKGAKWKVFVA